MITKTPQRCIECIEYLSKTIPHIQPHTHTDINPPTQTINQSTDQPIKRKKKEVKG